MKFTEEARKEFINLMLPYVEKLNRLAMFLCKDKVKAEELVAETIAKACMNIHRLRDKSKFRQWIFRIMNNEFINIYRMEKNVPTVELRESYEDDGINDYSLNTRNSLVVNSWGSNPELEAINSFIDSDIQKAISSLPDEFKMVVVLCDAENLSYKEISQILKIPVGTVRSRLSRGRAILQKKLRGHALEMGIISEKHIEAELCECAEPTKKRVRRKPSYETNK
jgi:RNA polymerase sigma-70 factor (ECF subfamily)